jgi:hypothetical protein
VERSINRRPRYLVIAAGIAIVTAACGDLPSKGDALKIVRSEVKEEANCTLPISLLSRLKMQHSSKAVCVPREGGAPMDEAMKCLDALVAAGTTKQMPADYMAGWPDELEGPGADSISPYERRARNLLFKGCVEMTGDLREGRFRCGEASAEKVLRVTKKTETTATVRYARAIKLDPTAASIEAACGQLTLPAPEGNVTLEKTDKRWRVVSSDEEATP